MYNKAMNKIIEFNGGPKRYESKYGLTSLEEVQGQLDAQKEKFEETKKELSAGNLANIDYMTETRKVLLDMRTVATSLSSGSREDAAIVTAVNERLADLDDAVEEGKQKRRA